MRQNQLIIISFIIPVFNRPDEVKELLESLTKQTNKDFEVVIVEDGSTEKCDHIVEEYDKSLNIRYFFKENTGPGTTRNYGLEKAIGNYYIFLDSDIIVPEKYVEIVYKTLEEKRYDAFGGPDAAHSSFSPTQKAINYSMTSFFTTGGIRGGKKSVDVFHPRSFNMGISKEVWEKTKGFSKMRFGEDVDFSLRIIEEGFTTGLIREAFVYHKRRNTFKTFYKQVNNSGVARINLFYRHPTSLKIVHMFPSIFVLGEILLLFLGILYPIFFLPIAIYMLLLFIDSLAKNKNLKVAFLSIISGLVQINGYGLGFLKAFWKRVILRKDEFHNFKKNFYK